MYIQYFIFRLFWFCFYFLQAASSHWWNFRHFQHHAKPNVIKKDPDIDIAYLFLIGDHIPKSWGTRKLGFMPYNFQHSYFFFCKHFLYLGRYMYSKSGTIYSRIVHFCLKSTCALLSNYPHKY